MMGHGMARNLLRKGYALRFKVHRNRANLQDLLEAGAQEAHGLSELVAPMLEGDLSGLKFAIANGQKDLRYFTRLTEALPTTSYLAEAAHQSFVQASNLGLGDRFIASLLEAQEQLNGVRIVPR
jgi:3-hydroxyisobutyrate dehydrogenase-like beta-hydroxyacid dehydrogenase